MLAPSTDGGFPPTNDAAVRGFYLTPQMRALRDEHAAVLRATSRQCSDQPNHHLAISRTIT
jgi:hypothetical protein